MTFISPLVNVTLFLLLFYCFACLKPGLLLEIRESSIEISGSKLEPLPQPCLVLVCLRWGLTNYCQAGFEPRSS
jgi:hypothetical protein